MSKSKEEVGSTIRWPTSPIRLVTITDLKRLNPTVTRVELRAALARRKDEVIYPRTKAREVIIKLLRAEAKRVGVSGAVKKLQPSGLPTVDYMTTKRLREWLDDLKSRPAATPLADKPKAAKKRPDYIDLDEEDEDLPRAPKDAGLPRAPKDAAAEQVGGDHYKQFAIQPAEIATRNGLSFLEGSVVKRMHRHSRGGKGLQDLQKAIHEIRLIAKWQYNEDI